MLADRYKGISFWSIATDEFLITVSSKLSVVINGALSPIKKGALLSGTLAVRTFFCFDKADKIISRASSNCSVCFSYFCTEFVSLSCSIVFIAERDFVERGESSGLSLANSEKAKASASEIESFNSSFIASTSTLVRCASS